jgi:hypothetical protein
MRSLKRAAAMESKNIPLMVILLGLWISSACVVTIPVPGYASAPLPATPDLNQAAPIQTQVILPTLTLANTDIPLPTWTPTETLTPFPSITPFPTATAIPSSSPIPVEIATLASLTGIPDATLTQMAQGPVASGDPIGSQYSCILGEKKPADKTVYPQKTSFTAWWDLTNAGTKKWKEEIIIVSLVEGKRMTANRWIQLPANVEPGETYRLKLEMVTPAYPDDFVMTWGLQVGANSRHFCFFTLHVIVK